jgi:putative acetyltransferase
MNHKMLNKNNQNELTNLFTSVFGLSEGEKEGELIGNLVSKLSAEIDNQEIICVGSCEGDVIIGSIFFTRLDFRELIDVYLLAPVAVRKEYQRMGVGQALINFGLNELKNRSVSVVITYGDPSYYSKVGFQSLSENLIQAPFKLLMPEGWLGQSLTEEPIPMIKEPPACVEAFNDPVFW